MQKEKEQGIFWVPSLACAGHGRLTVSGSPRGRFAASVDSFGEVPRRRFGKPLKIQCQRLSGGSWQVGVIPPLTGSAISQKRGEGARGVEATARVWSQKHPGSTFPGEKSRG